MDKLASTQSQITTLSKELERLTNELLKAAEAQYKQDNDAKKLRTTFSAVSDPLRENSAFLQELVRTIDTRLSKTLATAPKVRRNSAQIAGRLSQVFQQTALESVLNSATESKPIPFIQPVPNSPKLKLAINEEAAAMIGAISSEVIVIAIAGMYRTGKSYLLNRLFSRQKGFDIGASVQACTKGIWIWGKPSQQKGEPFVVLMDTEGLGDPQQTDNSYDPIIFSLSILLSSYFIYNSLGTINDPAIQQLSLVTQLTERIKSRSNSSNNMELDEHFPPFLWVVRDFNLMLVDKVGKPITEKEYLEDSLKNKPGYTKEVQERNNILNALRGFFKDRDCAVLPRPVASSDDLQRLEDLPVWHLHPEFKTKMSDLTAKILNTAPVKTVCGSKISGHLLVLLAQAYVKAINEDAVPTIHSAYESVVIIECQNAMKTSIEYYRTEMDAFVAKAKGDPITADALSAQHAQLLQVCIEKFVVRAIGDKENKIQSQMQDEIADYSEHGQLVGGIYYSVWTANERCTLAHSTKTLEDLHTRIVVPKIKSRAYMPPNGSFANYQTDMEEVVQSFERKKRGFPWKSAEALASFLEQKKRESEQLISDGAFIDAKNKELANIQLQTQQEKALREKKEAELKNLHNQVIEQNNAHLAHVNSLQQQQQRELAAAQARNNTLMSQRLAEQQRLLQAGFATQAAQQQSQIDSLRNQYNNMEASRQNQLNSLNSQLASVQQQLHAAQNRPPAHHHVSHSHGCFAVTATVNVHTADSILRVQIDQVCVGDRVEVVDADGHVAVSEVYWVDVHCDEVVDMLEVHALDPTHGDEVVLTLTAEHLIYASRRSDCQSPFNNQPIPATALCKGDYVWAQTSFEPNLRLCAVESLHLVKRKGMVNLFTLANNVIVNNVMASCHIVNHRWQVFDALFIRAMYKVAPEFSASNTFRNAVKKWDEVFEERLVALVNKFSLY